MVTLLVHHGADLHHPCGSRQQTPLYVACDGGHLPVVELLLQQGAGPTPNGQGRTPLMVASLNNYMEVVQCLLHHPTTTSTIDSRDDHGWTALRCAFARRSPPVIRLLLQAGADPTKTIYQGRVLMDLAKCPTTTTTTRVDENDPCVELLKVRRGH